MIQKVDIIVGLQFGSEGKGLIAGHLGCSGTYDTVVNVNMPNAGHTYIDKNGRKFIFKVLPNGAISRHVKRVMLGPDSVFDLNRLLIELDEVGGNIWDKLIIHENASWLKKEHTVAEADLMNRIGSTAQGSGVAMVSKIMRADEAIIKFDPGELRTVMVTNAQWMEHLADSNNILLEGCQGFSLGINAGFYPYCTSRDCTPTRLLAGAGIPYQWARKVIGVARLHPIRVGGNSGPGYEDQNELDWSLDIGRQPEMTTVTKRQRRIFNFSRIQMKRAIIACQPNQIFFNFCNYDPALSVIIKDVINTMLKEHGPYNSRITHTGWGPNDKDITHEVEV